MITNLAANSCTAIPSSILPNICINSFFKLVMYFHSIQEYFIYNIIGHFYLQVVHIV